MTTQEIISAWKKQANAKTNTAIQYIFCSLAREVIKADSEQGINHDRVLEHLKRAFSPVINPIKITLGGRRPYDTLLVKLVEIYSFNVSTPHIAASLGLTITEDQEKQIRKLAAELSAKLRGYAY